MIDADKVCQKIMKILVLNGFTNEVEQGEVNKVIGLLRGSDPRTLRNWMTALEIRALLNRSRMTPSGKIIYDINLKACPELLSDILHGERQKKLM